MKVKQYYVAVNASHLSLKGQRFVDGRLFRFCGTTFF